VIRIVERFATGRIDLARYRQLRWCRLGWRLKLSASSKYAQQFSQIFALKNMQSPNHNDH
jgi:hypothetical protein